ncbi:MAG: PEP-CTERM sorting domain-containing protein [Burkholderiales bacterium]|nr:PEP-CTERM sorting domain-containing protein [Burkholderiales bacterium]
MKKLAFAVALSAIFAAGQAAAVPTFSLAGGYTGAIKIKFTNWESFNSSFPSPGDVNYGILKITSIESDDGNNTQLWNDGKDGGEITGIFRDITVASTSGTGPVNIKSSGGLLDIYINPLGSFAAAGGASQGSSGYTDAGCATNGSCYDGISNVAMGGLFLSLAWASGIDAGNGAITIDGDLDGGTFPGTGDAAGFLNVTGGLYASNFDSNGLPSAFGARDMFAQNDFCVNGAVGCAFPSQGDWQLVSEDPVRAFFIPEPGSLALVGLSLFGIAAVGRRSARRQG